jgi:hypothetical protein
MTTYTLWDAFIWAMSSDRWGHTLNVAFWIYILTVFLTTIVWGRPLFSIFNPKVKWFWIRNVYGFSVSLFFTSFILYSFDKQHLFEKLKVFGYILN